MASERAKEGVARQEKQWLLVFSSAAELIYTKAVEDTKTSTLMPIIRKKTMPDSNVYTDSYRSYNAFDVNKFYHFRINHSTEFAKPNGNHINRIENFWNQAKRILRKYNGIPKNHFSLFLKECEFKFNCGTPKQQLAILKKWCYKSSNLL